VFGRLHLDGDRGEVIQDGLEAIHILDLRDSCHKRLRGGVVKVVRLPDRGEWSLYEGAISLLPRFD